MAHYLIDISAHGFGHLAISAPVLNRMAQRAPQLRLTLRSALAPQILRRRISAPFEHINAAADVGFIMRDALAIDHEASFNAWRRRHAGRRQRLAADIELLRRLKIDAVCSNIACLPLAAASAASIPAAALCSLNWADLFEHFYAGRDGAAAIHADLAAAYRDTPFLRPTPAMAMTAPQQQIDIGVIAARGRQRRDELRRRLGLAASARIIIVSLGGIPGQLSLAHWPQLAATHWLAPRAWIGQRSDQHALEDLDWPFIDLLGSADALIGKPGYGSFCEAACNGLAVIYQRRDDWPEQDYLIAWLQKNARCAEISAADLAAGRCGELLQHCLAAKPPPTPAADGVEQAAQYLLQLTGQGE